MSRAHLCLLVLTCTFAAGCAGNRGNVADDTPLAATAAAVEGGAPAIVDGNQLAARAAQTPICREVLRRNSNVHVMECRTAEQWKQYRRAEAEAAGELVRQMQGSAFRR